MIRETLTLDDFISRAIQEIRGSFIQERLVGEMSFTTAVNMVLLRRLVGADAFQDEHWELLRDFLRERGPHLEFDSVTDRRANI